MDTLAKIIELCESEIKDYSDNPIVEDGTQGICDGRLEFAQSVLNIVNTEQETPD